MDVDCGETEIGWSWVEGFRREEGRGKKRGINPKQFLLLFVRPGDLSQSGSAPEAIFTLR